MVELLVALGVCWLGENENGAKDERRMWRYGGKKGEREMAGRRTVLKSRRRPAGRMPLHRMIRLMMIR